MKFFKLFWLFVYLSAINTSSAQSGSFSSIQMTGGGTSSNIRPRITLNKLNYPIITWNKTSNKIISFSAWNGTMFNTPTTLTPTGLQADVFTWAGQEIASNKDTAFIVYASLMGTESNVFIHKSIDGGLTFSDTLRVSNIGTDKARFPTVGMNDAGNPVVGFMRMLFDWSEPKYVVTNSMNGGGSFMPDIDASTNLSGNEVCDCCPANITCKGTQQIVTFRDNNANQRDIRAVISNNQGNAFDTIVNVDFNNWILSACPSTGPDAHFGVDSFFTVFATGASTPMKVYISAMHPTSLQVGTHKVISSSSETQQYPRIAGLNDTIGIVWQQNSKVMFSYSTNGIAGLTNAIRVNDSADLSSNPDIVFADHVFHITWQSNSGMVHYRTFDLLGTLGVQNFASNEIHISPNPSSNVWHVDMSPQNEMTFLSLYDVNGKEMFSKTILANSNQQHKILNNHLTSGNYILKIQSGKKSGAWLLVKL
ncbi:MAG: T9SS type A sorting domain-containing protein [Bacteroidetes bacterium]|nr:T9SS type A sorting domain-containing protein [Bacteroidota bacterium]